jgi:hypothetical protein
VYKGRLSLAICKPSIRRTAKEGDWIFGFGGRDLGGRLIFIARVTKRVENGSYYMDGVYRGRPDRVYRREGGQFVPRQGARYHADGSQRERDLGKPPSYANAVTLLSDDFRYWGKNGTSDYRGRFPAVAALLDRLARGHRVNLSDAERQELVELQRSQWQAHPKAKVLGAPSQGDPRKVCNRSEGGVGSGSLEP